MESAHFPHADVQKIAPKTNKFKQRRFTSTKSDKKYVCVVIYFVDLIKYKLPAAHHYFYPKKYFDKN